MVPSRVAAVLLFTVSLVLSTAGDANAQRRGGGASYRAPYGAGDHRLEIVGYGGYRWTVSRDATIGLTSGKIDVENSGFWGLALDINVPAPDTQIRLVYDRQDAKFQYKQALPPAAPLEIDGSVEYIQVGAIKGLRQQNILPFGLFTLGASRFAVDAEDSWKFSATLGLGAKIYINDRIGLIAQGRMPFSFTDTFVTVGTGGAGLSGTGIAQFDIGGGIVILL